MFWVNTKRVIKAGFVGVWRNAFVSLSSVLVMVVTLFVIGSLVFLLAMLNASLNEVRNKVDINIYLSTVATEEDAMQVKQLVETLPQTEKVEYISSASALENFKQRHQNDELTLQALEELGSNPLGGILNVKAKDPTQYEVIAQMLQGDTLLSPVKKAVIDRVNFYDNKTAIDTLTRIIGSASTLGFAITIVLAVISMLIAFNTIRLAIYISREEISVMRLVGASNKYIRGPFVVAGITYGIIAGLITLIIFCPLTYWLGDATNNFFSGVNIFHYYLANFGAFFSIIMGAGVCLGAISSFLAVRRYLHV
jgi:cell division transport system permease protein